MPSSTATKTTTRKRKSLSNASNADLKDEPEKRRRTLDTFFTHHLTVDVPTAPNEATSVREEENKQHIVLNEEQTNVIKMVVEEGKSVFFTGAAGEPLFVWYSAEAWPHTWRRKSLNSSSNLLGTGKSLLLRAIIAALRRKYAKTPEAVSITASTGMAASNIGGTSHCFI